MQNTSAVPAQLTLVFPVWDRLGSILLRARDLISFWSRFPVPVEILFVVDPSHFTASELTTALAELAIPASRLEFRVLMNEKRLGRGASVLRGMTEARGSVIAVASSDFSVPLGEIFSGFQEFLMQTDAHFLLIGNRRGLKKKRNAVKTGLRAFFEGVEHEKGHKLGLKDPTSPFIMIRHEDWTSLGLRSLRRWFYTPGIALAARRKGLEVRELEVKCQDHPQSRMKFWDAIR